MWALLLAALNRFIRNEPCVAATTQIAASRMCPARDIALVLVWNAECQSIDLNMAGDREMKDVLVTIVQKPLRVDRFEMSARYGRAVFVLNGDCLDPMNAVLQDKRLS